MGQLMLLTGAFRRNLDQKARVALPRPVRRAMAAPEGGGVYLAPGTDGSLVCYTEEAFERLAQQLAAQPPTRHDVRAFRRLFYGRAHRVEIDAQGRVRIPAELAELAGLNKEVVLLGVQDHLEIWAAERWEAYLAERRAAYDQIAESAFGGPQGG